jgi:hypothetical protein
MIPRFRCNVSISLTSLRICSHQCCRSGSGAFLTHGFLTRCLFDPRIRDKFLSSSETHIFESIMTISCVRSTKILTELAKPSVPCRINKDKDQKLNSDQAIREVKRLNLLDECVDEE